MYGTQKKFDANLVATPGFPGVYPLPAVGAPSPAIGQVPTGENPGKSGGGLPEEEVVALCDSILGGSRSTSERDENRRQFLAVDSSGNNHDPDHISRDLPNINDHFEDVMELEKNNDGGNDGRRSGSIAGDVLEPQEPIDPASLPDEVYMDVMFAPLPKKDGAGSAVELSWEEFIEKLSCEFPSNSPEDAVVNGGGNVGGENVFIPVDMSDEDYIDRMFAPLSPKDRMRLVKDRARRSSAKEHVGRSTALDHGMCAESPSDANNIKLPYKVGDDMPRDVAGNALRNTYHAAHVGVAVQVSTAIVCAATHNEARGPSKTTSGEGPDRDSATKRAVLTAARQEPSNAVAPTQGKQCTKRKRSSRKKAAKGAQGMVEGNKPKRRRTRVEDMNPADVHACDYEGCGKRFARKYNLTVHQRAHRDEFRFRCEVPHCGKPFMWHSSLSRHLRVHEKRRRLGGRKQHGTRLRKGGAKAPCSQATRGAPPAKPPSAAVKKRELLTELETVRKLVSTVSFDQTMVALMGKKENRVGKDLHIETQLEGRWHQFALRKQQLAEQRVAVITMSNVTYSRLSAEILNSRATGNT